MDRRRVWRRIRQVWFTLGLSGTAIFAAWSLVAYRATASARLAIQPDSTVTVQHRGGIWGFLPTPAPSSDRPALVFFPGALVDPVAYAPLLRAAAHAGFAAYLVELPRRGAFGGADNPELASRFNRLVNDSNTARAWVIAGHSRGAVVASALASEHRSGLAGLVLIGSSHPRDVDLSTLQVAVTKVVGTRDGLAPPAKVDANRSKLPAHTRWVWIQGGNHSQFGWYGFQPGDHRATIAATTQHALMTQAVLDALRQATIGAPEQPGR